MFLHPSNLLFFSLLSSTIFVIVSADSWLMMWLFMEINLLLFIPLMFMKKSKYQSEASLKYFINQAMSSVLILSSATFLTSSPLLMYLTLCSSFSLKMGVAPLHSWLVLVSSSISWFSLWLLLVPQKIAPMLIMSILVKEQTMFMMYFLVTLSSLVGALGGLMTPSLKKIITYSSISQMAWLVCSLLLGQSLWVLYYLLYSIISSVILASLAYMKMSKLNDLLTLKMGYMKILMMINMLSMAGLPPFSGFLMKLTLATKMMETCKFMLLAPLILSSLISLYFYTRVFYTNSVNSFYKKMNDKNYKNLNLYLYMNVAALPLGGYVLFT